MTPKKLHRFLIETLPSDKTWTITDTHLMHQLFDVLKIRIGESIIVFGNDTDDVTVRLTDRDKHSVTVERVSGAEKIALPRTVIAAVSIAKGATFELIVQKLTELGISEIVPLITDRTVKQSVRNERLEKISTEALEQSGGAHVVTIHEPMTLEQCIKAFPVESVLFDAYTETTEYAAPERVIYYVGPEGGWSDKDRMLLGTLSPVTLVLGKTILRTETAAIIGAYKLLWQ